MTSVTRLDPGQFQTRQAVLSLLSNAFGSFPQGSYDHILTSPRNGSILYGVIEQSEIVAINAFIAHSVHRAGRVGLAYQSCLSATRDDQKGKGHFSRIIEFAKKDLREQGGAFIFGFPNRNSGPIFVGKLGFTISNNVPCIVVSSSVLPFGSIDKHVLLNELSNSTRAYFDMYETAVWKKYIDSDNFFEYEKLTNYLFGRVVRRSVLGIRMSLLVIGGYEINKPLQVNRFLKGAMRASGASLARMTANSAGPIAKASRFTRSELLTEPTIAFSLNWDIDARDVEACAGLKDVY